jgi:hypothetical protein
VTGFLQVQRHWVAHDAGADKSDFSHEKILLFLLLYSQNSWGGSEDAFAGKPRSYRQPRPL